MTRDSYEDNFNNNAFNNIMEIYFNPEIEKRKQNNTLEENFELITAQVFIFPDERPNIIRLNAEVQANVNIKEGVNKDTSDYFPNCQDIESIEISENEYLNCGHIIIIRFKDYYQLKFDFIYNKKTCKSLLDNSFQFLKTAEFALKNNFFNSYIDNAFRI